MSNVLKELVVKLEAQTGQFEKSMKSVQGTFSTLKTAVGAIGAVLAVDKFVSWGSAIAKDADFMAKLAQQTNSSVMQIETLRLALTQSGVDFKTFMEPMQKLKLFIGQALAEGDTNKFSKIGLDAKEFISIPIDKQFIAISEALAKFSNDAERAAAMNQIFGEMGVKAMNAFADGGKAIKEASAFFQELGISTDPQKIEDMNDRIAESSAALRLLSTKILSEVSPAFLDWAKGMVSVIKYLNEIEMGTDSLGNKLSVWDALNKKIDSIGGIGEGIKSIFSGGGDAADIFDAQVVENYNTALIKLGESVQAGIIGQEEYKKSVADVFAQKGNLLATPTSEKRDVANRGQIESAAKIHLETPKWSEEQMALGKFMEDAAKTIQAQEAALSATLQGLGDSLKDKMVTPTEAYDKAVKNLGEALKRGLVTQDEYNFGLKDAYETLQKTDPVISASIAATEKYADKTKILRDEMDKLRNMHARGLIDPGTLTRGLKEMQDSLNELNPSYKEGEEAIEKYADKSATLREEMGALKELFANGAIDSGTLQRGLSEIQSSLDDMNPSIQAARDRFEDLKSSAASIYEETRTPLEKLNKEMQNIRDMVDAGVIGGDTAARASQKRLEEYNSATKTELPEIEKRSVWAGTAENSGSMAGIMAASKIGSGNNVQNEQLNELRKISKALLENNPYGMVGVYAR